MDIKPFSQPFPEFWTSLEPFSVVFLGITAILIVVIAVVAFFDNLRVACFPLTLLAFVVGLSGMAAGYTDMHNEHLEHYNDAISELEDSLASDGFQTVSGTPTLQPNTQSSMLLSYEGKNFDCTLFSPKDVNANVVFSCGEAKLTLAQVKEAK